MNDLEGETPFSVGRLEDDLRKNILHLALKGCSFNQHETARLLGLSEHALRYQMKRYRIPSARKRFSAKHASF